jgi:hypothetical protein
MNQYSCETCKNWDNFYHGCNLFIFETRLDKKKETIHPYMHEDGYKTIEFVGCASHSDYQSERDKAILNLIKFVERNTVKQGTRSGWILESIVIDKLKELRKAGG